MRRLCVAALIILGACDDSEVPGRGGNKEAPQRKVGDFVAPQHVQAARFVATSGKDSAKQVEWGSVTRANALAVVQVAASMGDAQLQAAAGVDDPIGTMVDKLATVDTEKEGEAESKAFASRWTGAKDCKAKPADDAPLSTLPASVEEKLPADYLATLKAVRSGSAFTVTCEGVEATVVLDGKGRVIAMDRLRKRDDSLTLELDEENRFKGYMDPSGE